VSAAEPRSEPRRDPGPAGGPTWRGALLVAALHLALKLPGLGRSGLWLDEVVAVHHAQRGLAGILAASQVDTSPPLHMLVLAVFERALGIAEWAVRLPSVLASAAAGAALWALSLRRLGLQGAVFASAFFLASDVNLALARQARPYALAVLLAVLAMDAFLAFRDAPTWRRAALVAALDLALVLTHYVGALLGAAQILSLLLPRREPAALRRFLGAQLPAAGLALLWVGPVVASGQGHKMDWLPAPWESIGRLVGWYANGMRWPGAFALLTGGALLAIAWARRRGAGPDPAFAWAAALWALAPLALGFALSLVQPVLHARYVLFATPGLALLWALGLLSVPQLVRTWAAVGALGLAGLGIGRSLAPVADWGAAAQLVKEAGADRVLLLPYWEANTLAYYLDPAAFRDPERTKERLAAGGVRFLGGGGEVAPEYVAGARSVLLLESGTARAGSGAAAHLALREAGFAIREERAFPGVRAARMERAGERR
jgi:mannosyltransferase